MTAPDFCYLDNNATTSVAPEVLAAMEPYFSTWWGNPSSAYSFGHRLSRTLDRAREEVAALIGADPGEIVFTSCGTESNNTAIASALALNPSRPHVLTTVVEHSATIKFCQHLQRRGVAVTYLPVSPEGALDLDLLESSIRSETAIVSVMWANNETGVLFPVAQIAEICRRKKVLFHSDAVQMAGKLPIDVSRAEVDFLSLSGHKIHAPKGIGALYVRSGTKFEPYIVGGGQEKGRRGGTENVAFIAGFGRAATLALERQGQDSSRLAVLRDHLETSLLQTVKCSWRNGAAAPRLPNTTNIAFAGVEAEGLLLLLDQAGICASSGSACTTGSLEPSHVLSAMGRAPALARGSLRFSLSHLTTEREVDRLLQVLPAAIQKLRESVDFDEAQWE